MVLVPFCTMQYINDPRLLLDDEETTDCRRLSPRKANVQFGCAAPKPRAEHRKQEIMYVFTLRNVKDGEELLADYGMKYLFQ